LNKYKDFYSRTFDKLKTFISGDDLIEFDITNPLSEHFQIQYPDKPEEKEPKKESLE